MTGDEETVPALSPVERGETNAVKLRVYLDELRRSGSNVPLNNDGEPNRTAIAAACGFRRNVLHTNKAAIRLLDEFLGKDSRLSDVSQIDSTAGAHSAQIGILEQRVIRLEQRLAVVSAERDELREQLARYKVIEEDVLKKGRRIIP